MPGTPNPSIDDLLELDDLVNGDIGAAQQEIVNRLVALLPGLIAAKNTAKGWSGADAMKVPAASDIQIAPTVITNRNKNMILVAMAETSEPEGIGGGFRSYWDLTVTVVGERLQATQQICTAWRRAECVKTVLRAFLNGCADSSGKVLWRSLTPSSMMLMDDEDDQISYVVVSQRMIQPPSYGTGY